MLDASRPSTLILSRQEVGERIEYPGSSIQYQACGWAWCLGGEEPGLHGKGARQSIGNREAGERGPQPRSIDLDVARST